MSDRSSVQLQGRHALPISGAFLVLVNLLPLVGVLFFGWHVFELILLFWAENLIIGALTVARFVVMYRLRNDGSMMFVIPFFVVHFGAFCLVHLALVLWWFKPDDPGAWSLTALLVPFAALALSHVVSFRLNFIGQGEYKRVEPNDLMTAPYRRIGVMHLAVLGGATLSVWFGESSAALVLLVIGKIGIDLAAHVHEHRLRTGQVQAPIPADRVSEHFDRAKFPRWDE